MKWSELRARVHRLDLQAKVVLVLLLVIAPIFLFVSLAVSQLTIPVIEEEMRLMGMHASRSLSEEIQGGRMLAPEKTAGLEQRILNTFYLQPNVVRVDVFRISAGNRLELAVTTADEEAVPQPPEGQVPERPLSLRRAQMEGPGYWEIWTPVRAKKGPITGLVHMEVSLQSAASLGRAVEKIMLTAGAVTIALLVLTLSYFLRRTIQNDRRLRQAESHNVELSEQLRDAERRLMVNEKFAVMGQLTASFAHEIGTPLNAVGGHLQLLQDEIQQVNGHRGWERRMEVISDQLLKIEKIVKSFLESTAKPSSQSQLMDLNQVLDKTVRIVSPRLEALGVRLERSLDKKLGPLKAVPLDMEQVFLNLLNNSLDSLQSKQRTHPWQASRLEVFSRHRKDGYKEWAELGVEDSGEGIGKENLKRVFEPFFTTKAIGEGTGLGLTICQEIAGRYRGKLYVESKEGAWTRVTLRMPYGGNA